MDGEEDWQSFQENRVIESRAGVDNVQGAFVGGISGCSAGGAADGLSGRVCDCGGTKGTDCGRSSGLCRGGEMALSSVLPVLLLAECELNYNV